jgi:hypothetical protein
VVGDDEEQRERLRERASPRSADPPRAGVALEVEAVTDVADELRRQLLPEHGGFCLKMVAAQVEGDGREQENGLRRRVKRWDGGAAEEETS